MNAIFTHHKPRKRYTRGLASVGIILAANYREFHRLACSMVWIASVTGGLVSMVHPTIEGNK